MTVPPVLPRRHFARAHLKAPCGPASAVDTRGSAALCPAHLKAPFFTATAMIGLMAHAGIVVRSSIILVDFMEPRLSLPLLARRSLPQI